MDVKEAIQLIEQGRFEEIDIEDLWKLEDVLASSSDYNAVQAYITFKRSNIANNLNTISLQMKTWVDANLQTMHQLDKGFNLFQLNSNSRFVYPEAQGIFSFFNNIDIKNSNDDSSDTVDKKSTFESFYSLGKLGAKEKLCLNEKFSKLKPEEQRNLYKDAVITSMQEDAFVLVSNQIFEDIMKKNPQARELMAQEKLKVESDACKRFNAISNEADTSYKISNTNVIGTLGASVNRIAEFSDMVEERTKSKALSLIVKRTNDKFATKYPVDYPTLSPLKKAMSLSFIAGSVGMAAYNASKLSKSIKDFTKKEGSNLFNMVKNNPAKTAVLGAGIAATIAASQASISSGIDIGLVGRNVADNWRVLTASIPFDVISNTFSNVAKSASVTATAIMASLSVAGAKASAAFSQNDTKKKSLLLKDLKKTILAGPLGKALKLNKKENSKETPKKQPVPSRPVLEGGIVNFETAKPVKIITAEREAAVQKHEYPLVAASFSGEKKVKMIHPEFKLDSYHTEPKRFTSNPLEAQSERNTTLEQPKVFYNRAAFKVPELRISKESRGIPNTELAIQTRNEYFSRKLSGR